MQDTPPQPFRLHVSYFDASLSRENETMHATDPDEIPPLSPSDRIQYEQLLKRHLLDLGMQRPTDARLQEKQRTQRALKRLRAGNYGQCIGCGVALDPGHLRSDPAWMLCPACGRHEPNHIARPRPPLGDEEDRTTRRVQAFADELTDYGRQSSVPNRRPQSTPLPPLDQVTSPISSRQAEQLRAQHSAFTRAIEKVRMQMFAVDWKTCNDVWAEFCDDLERHLRYEERELFPAFAASNREAAQDVEALKSGHDRLRREIERVGIDVQLHQARPETVELLLQELARHVEREDELFYPWLSHGH